MRLHTRGKSNGVTERKEGLRNLRLKDEPPMNKAPATKRFLGEHTNHKVFEGL